MPEKFLLERHFLRAEFDPSMPIKVVAVGALLRRAMGPARPSRELEELASQLTRH